MTELVNAVNNTTTILNNSSQSYYEAYIKPYSWIIHPALAFSVACVPIAFAPYPATIIATYSISLALGLGITYMTKNERIDAENAAFLMGRTIDPVFAANLVNFLHNKPGSPPIPSALVKSMDKTFIANLGKFLTDNPTPVDLTKGVDATFITNLAKFLSNQANPPIAIDLTQGMDHILAAKIADFVNNPTPPLPMDLTKGVIPSIAYICMYKMFTDAVANAEPEDHITDTIHAPNWESTIFTLSLTTAFLSKFVFAGYSLPVIFVVGGVSYLVMGLLTESLEHLILDKPLHLIQGALGYPWDNEVIVTHALDKAKFDLQNHKSYGSKDWNKAMEAFKNATSEVIKYSAAHKKNLNLDEVQFEFELALTKGLNASNEHAELTDILRFTNSHFAEFLGNFTVETSTSIARGELLKMFALGGINNVFYNIDLTNVLPGELLEQIVMALGYVPAEASFATGGIVPFDILKMTASIGLIEGFEGLFKSYSYPREWLDNAFEKVADTGSELFVYLYNTTPVSNHTEI
jgi:hypothetical protein